MSPVYEAAIAAGNHMHSIYLKDPQGFLKNISMRGQYLSIIGSAYYALVKEKLIDNITDMNAFQYIEYHKKASTFYTGTDQGYINRLIQMQAVIDYFSK
jgi:hypothetical protein